MAQTASDPRVSYLVLGFAAISRYFHLGTHEEHRPLECGCQCHVGAGIGNFDLGDRAGFTQTGLPFQTVVLEQTALLDIAPAVVVSIKEAAFLAGGGSHQ